MSTTTTCPRCNRSYTCPPAMSRVDGSDICPVCGAEEGLNAVGINKEAAHGILSTIEDSERKAGRIV